MVEYYGWLRILDNSYESNDVELLRILEEVKYAINQLNNNRILEVKCLNGRCLLCIAGSNNHKTRDVIEVIELFKTVSKVAPGSYGLLYLLDDEDNQKKEDEFQVYKVAKGKITIERDILLSPCSVEIFE